MLLPDHVMAHHLGIMTADISVCRNVGYNYNSVTAISKMMRAADRLSVAGLVTVTGRVLVLPYKGSPLHTCY